MLANVKLVTLSLASLAALVLPSAAAPVESAHSLEPRGTTVCESFSQVIFPSAGQTIKKDHPFEVVYCSGAYFKIRTLSVEAFFSPKDNETSGLFGDVLGPLNSVSPTFGQFAFANNFSVPAEFQSEKQGFIYVQEKTTQYGGSGTSLNLFKVPVTLA